MKYINKFIAAGLGFALVFTGTNFVHGMFTSRAVQENIITIQKPNIKVDAKHAYFYGKDVAGVKYDKLYIPVTVEGVEGSKLKIMANVEGKNDGTSITNDYITIGNGVHIKNDGYPNDTQTNCIIISLPEGLEFGVKVKYNITLTVKIDGYTKPIFEQTYGIEKQSQKNDCVADGGSRIQHIPMTNPHEKFNLDEEVLIEENNEEIEVPSAPEIVDPPKEEIEKPVEPEVAEPSKEEITEIQNQPEVIELPRENEGIQE